MAYKREFTDILNTLISSMSFPVVINTSVVNLDGSITLACDNIYFAQVGFDVTINAIVYRITAIDQANESITITGTGVVNDGDTFNMYTPHFFHGTPIATTQELKSELNASAKTPMIWLWENFTEDFYDEFSALERDVDCELYFLTQADFDGWETSDAYTNAIKPMKRLVDLFIEAINTDTANFYFNSSRYKSENYSKFGVFIREKGSSRNLFADKLSGVGVDFTLIINKTDVCDTTFFPDLVGIGYDAIGQTLIA
jgi:hypothetical protein